MNHGSLIEQPPDPSSPERTSMNADPHSFSRPLYISHFISTWNSRGFEFGAVLFLAAIYPGTLLPVSIYALFRASAAVCLAPVVGKFIDSQNRLKVIRASILGQRLAVVASCFCFISFLQLEIEDKQIFQVILFSSLVILACGEKLCSVMNTVAVERDWVVVIAGEDEHQLQILNSQMRRIDLFCKLVSPLAIALLDGISTRIAVVSTLFLNLGTSGVEYFLIAWVYSRTPALASTKQSQPSSRNEASSSGSSCFRSLASLTAPLGLYAKSHAFLPSLSLSVLYLTVLSFSGQMITYLLSLDAPKLTSLHIGMIRTCATVFEISSTFIAPRLINHLGAVRAGIWCLSWQALWLTLGVSPFWLPVNNAALATSVLIASVVFSRIGLWSFDLTAQLLIQNSIDSNQRGSFSATEASLQNFFELCAFATTIAWSRPDQFKFPASVSLAATCVAAALYAHFVRTRRGHLLHLPDCCKATSTYYALRTTGEEEDEEEDVELTEAARTQE